jgi:hypothetical protein
MRLALIALVLASLSLPAHARQKGQGRGWRHWKRGAATAKKDRTRPHAATRGAGLTHALASRTAPPHVRPRITALSGELDARVARMARDGNLEFDLLFGVSDLVAEARALTADADGDRAATAELEAYTVKLANALAPALGPTARVRESDPTTARKNLTWIRRISGSPYSDWGMGGLQAIDHELKVGLGNLAEARQQAVALTREVSVRKADIEWLAERSGVDLKVPTVEAQNARIDQAERSLRRVHANLRSSIIGRL